MVALAVIAVLLAVVTRLVRTGWEKVTDFECAVNLNAIGLALYQYQQAQGAFPPAFVTDSEGRPLFSWRVLVLPYLGRQDVYDRFHLDEPWDSPHNRKLLDAMPSSFACPARQKRVAPGRLINVLALVAPGTTLPGSGSVRIEQILDDPDRTLMLVESSQADIPWTAPIDLDPRTGRLTNTHDPGPIGPTSDYRSGWINTVAANGVVRSYAPDTLRKSLVPASTIAGGEALDFDDPRGARP
jgi:hypothetical protein